MSAGRGTLVLVVGPSGVGKDSVIAGARARFRGEDRLVFARRIITRSSDAGGEDHIAVSPDEFAEMRQYGRLMLHWEAHGLAYGLPRGLAHALEQGRSVVANVSRTVLDTARRNFAPAIVVTVTASPATLARRLALRGREKTGDIEARLARGVTLAGVDADHVIANDGALHDAVEAFVAVLNRVLDQTEAVVPSG